MFRVHFLNKIFENFITCLNFLILMIDRSRFSLSLQLLFSTSVMWNWYHRFQNLLFLNIHQIIRIRRVTINIDDSFFNYFSYFRLFDNDLFLRIALTKLPIRDLIKSNLSIFPNVFFFFKHKQIVIWELDMGINPWFWRHSQLKRVEVIFKLLNLLFQWPNHLLLRSNNHLICFYLLIKFLNMFVSSFCLIFNLIKMLFSLPHSIFKLNVRFSQLFFSFKNFLLLFLMLLELLL